MPIYEYRCSSCEHIKEIFQSIKDDEDREVVCDVCNKKMKKIISVSNFILKGTGWYKTDYKSSQDKGKKDEDKK